MVGFMRLLVCGGLFVAGYYLGRQSIRMELDRDQSGIPEPADAASDPEPAAPKNE